MIRVLAFVPDVYDVSPGQRYRIEQWESFLRLCGVEITYVPFLSRDARSTLSAPGHYIKKASLVCSSFVKRLDELRSARLFDVVYVYRELAVVGPPWLERLLAYMHVPVVFDFDDAIFLPQISVANGYLSLLKFARRKTRALCRLSAHVIVGNAYLAAYARQFSPHVSVVPTSMDLRKYTVRPQDNRNIPVIGWTGSHSTSKYLGAIRGVLERLGKLERFRFCLIGSSGQQFQLVNTTVNIMRWRSETEVDDLRALDIGIMPLPDDPWTRGKCACKALQYMALAIPVVCSRVGVAQELIEDGVNGFLADSDQEWLEKLSYLLTDPGLRQRIGIKGRQTVEERYSGELSAKHALSIFRSVGEPIPGSDW